MKLVKMYIHADSDSAYDKGVKLGLKGAALEQFAHWGYELEVELEVHMHTGKTRIVSVDGRKLVD